MSVPLSSMLAPALLRRSPFSPVKNNHANKGKNKENSSRLHSLLAYESFSPIASTFPEVCRTIFIYAAPMLSLLDSICFQVFAFLPIDVFIQCAYHIVLCLNDNGIG